MFFPVISPSYKRHNTLDVFPRGSNHLALYTCDYILFSPAHQIGALQDLQKMPQADLTVVGERGWTLSGGQKIRLNLAR